nr:glucose/ribitol dehydrogenase [Tanacetum cinerariifolium]
MQENIDETTGEEYVEHADAGIVVMILKTLIFYVEQGAQVDISVNEDTIKADVDKAWGVFGRINALINNAGIAVLLNLLKVRDNGAQDDRNEG